MTCSRVIILNGVRSAGKSSIAQALKAMIRQPVQCVAMDDYLAKLPPEVFGTPAGLTFVTRKVDSSPLTEVLVGPLAQAALTKMREAIAALAAAGADVIVDDVMLGPNDDADYRRLMPDVEVRLVAIMAPLAVVEERERVRGDRTLGLARWQFDRVHAGRRYDLEIDSSTGTPAEHATTIRNAFDL